MVDRVFGDAGEEVVVEEFLTGPEISVLALSDGYSSVLLPAAQDHKKIGEGDTVCTVHVFNLNTNLNDGKIRCALHGEV